MNKIITFLVLLFSFNSFSQTSTEKWNSLYERYEYFDSSGTMTGYKKYNSLYERWEYFDLKKSNSDKSYQVQQPVSSIPNLDVIDKTLTTKQSKHDYNSTKINKYILEVFETLDYSGMHIDLIKNIKNSFRNNYILPYYNKKYDLSSDSLTNNIIEWLQEGLLSTIKIETEKFNENSKNNSTVLMLEGGYTVPLIKEETQIGTEHISTMTEQDNGFLFFYKDMLWFKRGKNDWKARKLTFKFFDSKTNAYVYNSDQGVVMINSKFEYVLFLDTNNPKKKYYYFIGLPDSSIIPKTN